MTRRTAIFGLVLAMLAGGAPLLAHTSFRFTGKITKWDRPQLTVATKENGAVKIKVEDDFATILYKGQKASTADLKVGRTVIIDAWGDSITDAEALKVNIDPTKKDIAADKDAK